MKKEELGKLILENKETMYRVAKTLLYNDADCADAIQEAIAKAFSKIYMLQQDKYAKTWLIRILINECYAIMRSEKRIVSLESYKQTVPDEIAEDKKDYSELYEAVYRLPEKAKIAGKDAIYLENVTQKEGEEPFKKMYVFFSEEHYVMELFISKEVSKEEAVKFAEGITLRPATAEDEKKDIVSDYVWSEYIANAEENEQISDDWYSIGKDDFCTREIGEKLDVGTLTACVEQVEVFDNINMLLPAYVDYNMLYEMGIVDKNGVLLDATKEYYKRGDGIHTVDEWIKTETTPLKLVYVTVSYTNNGEEDLEEVIFGGSLLHTVDEGEKLTVWNHKYTDGENEFIDLGYGGYYKEIMLYYDVHGGEKNNNYIPCIKAGETVTVHMGFLVLEEMLPHMYLNLDTYSGGLEFSESALKIGYVDIRQ